MFMTFADRNLYSHLPLDEEFDDLVVVGVSSEHDGSYVRCEL